MFFTHHLGKFAQKIHIFADFFQNISKIYTKIITVNVSLKYFQNISFFKRKSFFQTFFEIFFYNLFYF